jgi:tRNAThr (cytosine32-N3)-methyltransferase
MTSPLKLLTESRDNFYKANANHFFRNRKWLHNEFPELVAATKADAGPVVITELGCGEF